MKLVALLCGLLALGAAAPAQAETPPSGAVIVKRAPALDADDRAALRERADVYAAGELPGLPRVEVVVPLDGDRDRALRDLRADPAVAWAEPVAARAIAADALQPQLWGLENSHQSVWGVRGTVGADVDALPAWELTRGAGATIAIVDTGAASAHPDLAPRLTGNAGERGPGQQANGIDDDGNGLVDDWRGWDFAGDDNDPEDGHGHGSHVAGTAAGAAGGGDVIGVAPEADVLVLQALGANGSGTTANVAAAFAYAGQRGVRVVNASLGSSSYSQAERSAIHAHPGTLYVVSAGNDGDDIDGAQTTYPCAYNEPNLLCVGASNQYDAAASFSNVGAARVDLFAPGVNIVSAYPPALSSVWGTAGYEIMQGTSMASPHVAGAAALVASAQPGLNGAQIKQALMAGADPIPALAGKAVTGGRLNAADALAVAAAPPAVPDPAPAPAPAPAPQPAPAPAPPSPIPPPAAAPLAVSGLRVVGTPRSCRLSCGASAAALAFTASRAGTATLTAERRACARGGCRYLRAGSATVTVGAGLQRLTLSPRLIRLRAGIWRVTLAGARTTFRVR